jgi:hypothetical protein
MSHEQRCFASDVAGTPRVVFFDEAVMTDVFGGGGVTDSDFFGWVEDRRDALLELAELALASNTSPSDEITIDRWC